MEVYLQNSDGLVTCFGHPRSYAQNAIRSFTPNWKLELFYKWMADNRLYGFWDGFPSSVARKRW